MLHLSYAHILKWVFELHLLITQGTREEDFSEPIADESSVHNEFISDSFAHHSEQGTYLIK